MVKIFERVVDVAGRGLLEGFHEIVMHARVERLERTLDGRHLFPPTRPLAPKKEFRFVGVDRYLHTSVAKRLAVAELMVRFVW